LAIIVLALVVRAIPLLAAWQTPQRYLTPDSFAYLALGGDLSANFQPASELFEQGLNRTPGYPMLVGASFALFGESIRSVIVMQFILSAVSIVVCYRLARCWFGDKIALTSAFLLGVDPLSACYVSYVQNEMLFTLCLMVATVLWCGVWQTASKGSAIISGLTFGFATLVRPAGLYLPLLLLPPLLLKSTPLRTRFACGGLFLASYLVPLGVWITHNYVYAGMPELSVIEGKELLYCRAAGAVSESRGITRLQAATELAEVLWSEHGVSLSDADRRVVAEHMKGNWIGLNRFFDEAVSVAGVSQTTSYGLLHAEKQLALKTLLDHPGGAIATAGKGGARLLFGPGLRNFLQLLGLDTIPGRSSRPAMILLAILVSCLGIFYLGAGLGFRALLRAKQHTALYILVGFILYFTLVSLGPTAYSRYRVPLMPYLCILAAYGFVNWRSALGKSFCTSEGRL
jgi:4-amino-4-deoxy-L-arabinose transferase-like glycosyltransferase